MQTLRERLEASERAVQRLSHVVEGERKALKEVSAQVGRVVDRTTALEGKYEALSRREREIPAHRHPELDVLGKRVKDVTGRVADLGQRVEELTGRVHAIVRALQGQGRRRR